MTTFYTLKPYPYFKHALFAFFWGSFVYCISEYGFETSVAISLGLFIGGLRSSLKLNTRVINITENDIIIKYSDSETHYPNLNMQHVRIGTLLFKLHWVQFKTNLGYNVFHFGLTQEKHANKAMMQILKSPALRTSAFKTAYGSRYCICS